MLLSLEYFPADLVEEDNISFCIFVPISTYWHISFLVCNLQFFQKNCIKLLRKSSTRKKVWRRAKSRLDPESVAITWEWSNKFHLLEYKWLSQCVCSRHIVYSLLPFIYRWRRNTSLVLILFSWLQLSFLFFIIRGLTNGSLMIGFGGQIFYFGSSLE